MNFSLELYDKIGNAVINQAYKFYGKMHFAEAVRRCQMDGTFLAMAKNRSDADDIKSMLQQSTDQGAYESTRTRIINTLLVSHDNSANSP